MIYGSTIVFLYVMPIPKRTSTDFLCVSGLGTVQKTYFFRWKFWNQKLPSSTWICNGSFPPGNNSLEKRPCLWFLDWTTKAQQHLKLLWQRETFHFFPCSRPSCAWASYWQPSNLISLPTNPFLFLSWLYFFFNTNHVTHSYFSRFYIQLSTFFLHVDFWRFWRFS